jgi:hypothetical protein
MSANPLPMASLATPRCGIATAFGRPVVPEVNIT